MLAILFSKMILSIKKFHARETYPHAFSIYARNLKIFLERKNPIIFKFLLSMSAKADEL